MTLSAKYGGVGHRDRSSATRTVIDQCHLTEDTEVAQRIEEAVAQADFNGSAFDDEHFQRWITKMTSPAL